MNNWNKVANLQRTMNQKMLGLMHTFEIELFDDESVKELKQEMFEIFAKAQRQANQACRQRLEKNTA